MRKRYLVGTAVFIVLLAAGAAWVVTTQDREKPVITIGDAQQITWHSGMEKSELLQGVTATDDRDGDVTESLIIESVKPEADEEEAVVTYVAKDSSNNVAKATRVVGYVSSGEDTEDIQQETEAEGETEIRENASPDIGASEEDTETDITDTQSSEELEEQAAAERDTAIAALSAQAPRFYLKQHYVSINAGESFDKLLWVQEITDDKDERSRLFQNIQILGEINTQVPGTYELKYHVVDRDGNRSNVELLTLTVN